MKKMLLVFMVISLMLFPLGCRSKKTEDPPELKAALDEKDPNSDLSPFPEFKAKDINGKVIDNTLFKDYKLTLVNIWATTCGPCIAELPELQELHLEMQELGVNVIGIIADGMMNGGVAKTILDKTSVTYTNIIPNEKLMTDFINYIMWVPTSIMVDGNGLLVGEAISGARSKEGYETIIKDVLESLR